MGWRWLVGPLAIVVGYRWLSPPTPDNSRRMHEVPAVLSVWAAAIGWLTLARAGGDEAMLFPYTVVFGAHLAMFGTSRLAFQFPDRPLPLLFWRAVVTGWAIVMVPYVLVTDATGSNLAVVLGAIGAIAIGTAAFVRALPAAALSAALGAKVGEPGIRNAPQTTRRWLYQAVAAGMASAAAWGMAMVASRWMAP